jgi:hypothetical protein
MLNLHDLRGDERFEFVRGDITQPGELEFLLKRWQPEAIVNFAAETHAGPGSGCAVPFFNIESRHLFDRRMGKRNPRDAARFDREHREIVWHASRQVQIQQGFALAIMHEKQPAWPSTSQLNQPFRPHSRSPGSGDLPATSFDCIGIGLFATNIPPQFLDRWHLGSVRLIDY